MDKSSEIATQLRSSKAGLRALVSWPDSPRRRAFKKREEPYIKQALEKKFYRNPFFPHAYFSPSEAAEGHEAEVRSLTLSHGENGLNPKATSCPPAFAVH
ncbi:hypothetical protein TRV_04871 [Trichophyton verrucosum HKI 0517]|uniref:Uncharacterized protein n=1 Tax=Trichophyton verrucosum (strain HKI 0517) TaxID=663202 RepID=D4DCL6_TRIVH|nr:uncharacterized protein TRV_04871 [Trichophyton verrucosum HKI 0517]EFE40388.1 hypothetical protein TRV_04871 [Trichophyton verrucosum HKI 0517]